MKLSELRAVIALVKDAVRCDECGKSVVVANLTGYRQAHQLERVTPETHCTCPGGPAHGLTPAEPAR